MSKPISHRTLSDSQDLPKGTRYDRVLILNLFDNSTYFQRALERITCPTLAIDLTDRLQLLTDVLKWEDLTASEQEFISQLTELSKIILFGHCKPGEPHVFSRSCKFLSHEALAKLIYKGAPQLIHSNHPRQINLCVRAMGSDSGKISDLTENYLPSFAERTCQSFWELGIRCKIIAGVPKLEVMVNSNGDIVSTLIQPVIQR